LRVAKPHFTFAQLRKNIMANRLLFTFMLIMMAPGLHLLAQENGSLIKDSTWSFHFQATVISQTHPGFRASYSGTNSLADTVEFGATSVTTTLFFGKKLWNGAAFYADPELSGGRGLSYSVGVAGALNGETYRIGNPAPLVSIARAYLQQNIPLDHSGNDSTDDDENQVAGKIPSSRITISAGKFSISDFYDRNAYSHDPRTQFLNWSLMSDGAWDYPANTKGYTTGLVVELIKPLWAFRVSSVAVPVIANHSEMEYVFGKAHSESIELESKTRIGERRGLIRLLFSYTASRAPSYAEGMNALKTGDTNLLNIISGNAENRVYGGKKMGLFLNAEQEITRDLGAFARIGWNDGKYVTWAFTEIDQTAHAGLHLQGSAWKRQEDVVGLAVVVNGVSAEHRDFLKNGGYGFIIGDGMLNYGHEAIVETFYSAKLYSSLWVTFDYQFVNNPGYNKDRGPVHVFSLRAHIAF
jgi:high affinity Mn2+ porin